MSYHEHLNEHRDIKKLTEPKNGLMERQSRQLMELISKTFTEGFLAGATRAAIAELGTGNLEDDIKAAWASSDIAALLSDFI